MTKKKYSAIESVEKKPSSLVAKDARGPESKTIKNAEKKSEKDKVKAKAKAKDSDKDKQNEKKNEPEPLNAKVFDKELRKLHVELVKLQKWVLHKGLKVCILFEGRDGAGKGGTIKALTERVNPRVFRVVALPAPTEREQSQMYLQRYVPHLPAAGEVVIFDRSWYNRAGVERVMGFCTKDQVEKFFRAVPLVERAMVDSGIILLKYWLEVSPEEQERRLQDRIEDGRKTWKLSPMDVKSFKLWDEYTQARDDMFEATDSSWAPWFVAESEDKRRVRLNVITHILEQIPYKKVPEEEVKLPKRKIKNLKGNQSKFKFVPNNYR